MAIYPELKGRIAVITGAAQGIGASTVRAFAQQHAMVALLDIDEFDAKKLASEIKEGGTRALAVRTDVTDPQSVIDALTRVAAEFGSIDILINSAGGYGKLAIVNGAQVVEGNAHCTFSTEHRYAQHAQP